ncbi:MAG: recombination mediator RecR [Bdellovibrionia bacterium]
MQRPPVDHRDPVAKLIFELSKLPGIGQKTAARLSYFILKQEETYAQALSDAVLNAKKKTHLCHLCLTFTHAQTCSICLDTERDTSLLCIVERPSDVYSLEQSHTFNGVYHVLHGTLSPLDGIGPEELKIRELLTRLQSTENNIREIILATNSSVEGEATSLYLIQLLKPLGMRLTKLAHGLPVGGLLEYTDRQTLSKALENRMEIN